MWGGASSCFRCTAFRASNKTEETPMKRTLLKMLSAALMAAAAGPTLAQTTQLKWAHVYESGEAYHKWALWAADEVKKRTNGRYDIQVFPASSLGKENRHQPGPDAGHGGHHLHGAGLCRAQLPAAGHRRRALHVPRLRPLAEVRPRSSAAGADGRLLQEERQQAAGRHLLRRAPHHRQQGDQQARGHGRPEAAASPMRRCT